MHLLTTFPCNSRLSMRFTHLEMQFLFIKEQHGATLETMCTFILDSKLYALRTVLVLYKCLVPQFFLYHLSMLIRVMWFRWYAHLGSYDLAVAHMLEILGCSHQSKTTQELFLKDFIQIIQVPTVPFLFLYACWKVKTNLGGWFVKKNATNSTDIVLWILCITCSPLPYLSISSYPSKHVIINCFCHPQFFLLWPCPCPYDSEMKIIVHNLWQNVYLCIMLSCYCVCVHVLFLWMYCLAWLPLDLENHRQ